MSDFVPVAFGTSFEALVARALTPMPPDVVGKLKAVGFDPTKPCQAAYPAEVWMETLRVVSETLFPCEPAEEGHRKLGRLYMEGFEKTLLGKAVFTLGHAIGPRRMLPRMTRNFRTANNFLDTDLKELAAGDWRMTVLTNPEAGAALRARTRLSAAFVQGLMQAILEARSSARADVSVEQCDPDRGQTVLRLKFGAVA
jgi:uncharacterized protein (TIGR02265 family)